MMELRQMVKTSVMTTILTFVLSIPVYYWYRKDYAQFRYTLDHGQIGYITDHVQFWYTELVAEQLGKAKYHFLEQAFLAQQLNRTLVLPNVGVSRIGMIYPHPFDLYYQTEPLSKILRHTSVSSFRSHPWHSRKTPITAALVFIMKHGQCSSENSSWSKIKSKTWLDFERTVNVTLLTPPACFEMNDGMKPPKYPWPILDFLRRDHFKTDIIVAVKLTGLFMMKPPAIPLNSLKHNRSLIQIVDAFSRSHRPYVAAHWRMETARANGITCARLLVKAAQRFNSSYRVYFATDHPFENERKSGTFTKCCRKDYHEGYNYVLSSLRPIMLNALPLGAIGGDPGSLSIVEKLICMHSDVFLPGNVPCARHGSFAREMIEFREYTTHAPWFYWNRPNEKYQRRWW